MLRVDSFKATNFRCFSEISGTLHPQCTVIIGDNGTGKSSVLDLIAIAVSPFTGAFEHGKATGFVARDAHIDAKQNESQYPINLSVTGQVGNHLETYERQLISPKSHTTTKDCRAISDYGRDLQKQVRTGLTELLPLLAYYGTGRVWSQAPLTQRKLKMVGRSAGYSNCWMPSSDFAMSKAWYFQMQKELFYNFFRKEAQTQILREFPEFQAISLMSFAVTKLLNEQYGLYLKPDGLFLEDSTQRVLEVSQLSDGVKGMVAVALDLAVRHLRLNPPENFDPGESLSKVTGIVMIDEIELHLHPSWQQTVVGSLKQLLPNVQLVLTTHSPQVLATLPREQIRVFQRDPLDQSKVSLVAPDNQSLGWSSDGVLQNLMGVHAYPDGDAKNEINEILDLAYQSTDFQNTAIRLGELKKKYGSSHPSLVQADLALARRRLKSRA